MSFFHGLQNFRTRVVLRTECCVQKWSLFNEALDISNSAIKVVAKLGAFRQVLLVIVEHGGPLEAPLPFQARNFSHDALFREL